ncbi:MAG: paraquat-inducible protein A [Pirellulales bacterium]
MSRNLLTSYARIVIVISAVFLGLGLVLPCMTIWPHFGAYDSWAQLLKPSLNSPTEYSVLSGILKLIEHGQVSIGLLLLFFSCIFPTIKLAILAWAVSLLKRGQHAGLLLKFAHHTGKYSMLDVLVLALIVIAIKGLPGSTQITLGIGVWMFAGSVILGILASILIHKLERMSH